MCQNSGGFGSTFHALRLVCESILNFWRQCSHLDKLTRPDALSKHIWSNIQRLGVVTLALFHARLRILEEPVANPDRATLAEYHRIIFKGVVSHNESHFQAPFRLAPFPDDQIQRSLAEDLNRSRRLGN